MAAMKEKMIEKMEEAREAMEEIYVRVAKKSGYPEAMKELHEKMMEDDDLCMEMVLNCEELGGDFAATVRGEYADMLYDAPDYRPWEE